VKVKENIERFFRKVQTSN